MSLEYKEQADIAFMREPNSCGVYRILKCKKYGQFSNLINPATTLVDHATFAMMYNTEGLKVCWYSVRMMFMEANFVLEEATP